MSSATGRAGSRGSACRRFEGRVALVTGGASGIGLATAERLLEEGAAVVIADLDGDAAEAAAVALRDRGLEHARAARCDVTRGDQVQALVADIVGRHERLDVLFSNAGIFEPGEVHEVDEEAWDRQLGVNLRAVYLVAHHVVPVMLAQGGGAIVNNASVAALVGDHAAAAYCASKGGVALLTKQMALDYAARGIRVNAICCGEIDTPLFVKESYQIGMTPDAYRELLNEAHPIGRIGLPSRGGRRGRVPGQRRRELRHRRAAAGRRRLRGPVGGVMRGLTYKWPWSPAAPRASASDRLSPGGGGRSVRSGAGTRRRRRQSPRGRPPRACERPCQRHTGRARRRLRRRRVRPPRGRDVARFGRLDILVNSAGIWIEKPTTQMSEEEYDRLDGHQPEGDVLHVPAALRHMAGRKAGVMQTSPATRATTASPTPPRIGRQGRRVMMNRAMAVDDGPDGVRVVSVSPAIFDTPMLAKAIADAPDPVAYFSVQNRAIRSGTSAGRRRSPPRWRSWPATRRAS